MGECRTHEVAAAMVGLPDGVASEVVGASALLGGRVKSWQPSAWEGRCRVDGGRRTYPADYTQPEAVGSALAGGSTGGPGRIGAVGGEELVEELLSALARHEGRVGRDVGDGAAGEDMVDGRRGVELCMGDEAGQDNKGQVMLDVCGRIRVHAELLLLLLLSMLGLGLRVGDVIGLAVGRRRSRHISRRRHKGSPVLSASSELTDCSRPGLVLPASCVLRPTPYSSPPPLASAYPTTPHTLLSSPYTPLHSTPLHSTRPRFAARAAPVAMAGQQQQILDTIFSMKRKLLRRDNGNPHTPPLPHASI